MSQSEDSDDDEIDGDDIIQKSRNDEDQDSGDQGRYWLYMRYADNHIDFASFTRNPFSLYLDEHPGQSGSRMNSSPDRKKGLGNGRPSYGLILIATQEFERSFIHFNGMHATNSSLRRTGNRTAGTSGTVPSRRVWR